jgi:glutamate racemase
LTLARECAVAEAPNILVFDSGLGGLTVYREVAGALPNARYLYVADDAFFPYGGRDEGALIARVLELMAGLIATRRPDLVIIACNTASTLVLPQLRARFQVPFIGTVPAIKPACAASVSKRVSVLGTQATIAREYTRALIRDFANGADITLVGSARLAALAEASLRGESVDDAAIAAELAPCFIDAGGRRTDTVVLACTHYPLLLDRLAALAPWPVRFIDPAPAIARRAIELIGTPPGPPPGEKARILFTSGRPPSPALAAALAGFGLGQAAPDRGCETAV